MMIVNYEPLLDLPCVAIIAPAGHGKTEAIAEMVALTQGHQLILTHTNAGVFALQKRLQKKEVDPKKYSVQTIAAFCMRWCMAYPKTAEIDKNVTPQIDAKAFYKQLYPGTGKIFSNKWTRSVLANSYSGLFVDEYQDCTIEQHAVVCSMLPCFPVRILGDPLQGIFYWAGTLVDWKTLIFPIEEPLTYPWRWEKTNPELGLWIRNMRFKLLAALDGNSVSIDLINFPSFVQIVSPNDADLSFIMKSTQPFRSVIYLTNLENQQKLFARLSGGIFTTDETQECKELHEFAWKMDRLAGCERALAVMNFSADCATKIKAELGAYYKNLEKNCKNFSRIKKHKVASEIIEEICNSRFNEISPLLQWFNWIEKEPQFKIFRKELFFEVKHCIKYASENTITFEDSARLIRNNNYCKKNSYSSRYLSSRTVLSKGLEFECVIIDLKTPMKAQDFYVALSRATKKIIIVTDKEKIIFN